MMHLDEKALEAAVLAHDKEEAAMRGEPDPWADDRPDGEFSDRKAAMALAIRAYLSAAYPNRDRALLVINNIQRGKVTRPSFNPHTGEVYDDA